mgnify:CR=1 FL=1
MVESYKKISSGSVKERRNHMSSNCQQKKMMNALGAIDTKAISSSSSSKTARHFSSSRATRSRFAWLQTMTARRPRGHTENTSAISDAPMKLPTLRLSRTPASDGQGGYPRKAQSAGNRADRIQRAVRSSWAIQGFGSALSTEIFETT